MSLCKRHFSLRKTTKKFHLKICGLARDDEGELLTFQRAGYILLNLDSRWKIAVPRLGASHNRHSPPTPSGGRHRCRFHNPDSLPRAARIPSSPSSSPTAPWGSAIRRPRSRQPPLPSYPSCTQCDLRSLLPSPQREILRILPLSFALDSVNEINPPGGSRRFSRVEPCRAKPSWAELDYATLRHAGKVGG